VNDIAKPRSFPAPASVSPEAQAVLNAGPPAAFPLPPASDGAAWETIINLLNEALLPSLKARLADAPAAAQLETLAGVPVYRGRPHAPRPEFAGRLVMHLHAGAMALYGGECVKYFAISEAWHMGCEVVSVDFRCPPKHPYPAALDDAVAVYRELAAAHGAQNIVVTGISGGGNIAAAAMHRLRDEGAGLPAGLVLQTAHVDLTESGDTWTTNVGLDTALSGSAAAFNQLYAVGKDLRQPLLSPLFGDFSKGYPRTLVQTGTRDLLLSSSVLMHRALRDAGLEAELHVGEAMPHGGFGGKAPEDEAMRTEIRRFLAKCWDVRLS
jgi:monoterpene epsilon-lactone hydrolase